MEESPDRRLDFLLRQRFNTQRSSCERTREIQQERTWEEKFNTQPSSCERRWEAAKSHFLRIILVLLSSLSDPRDKWPILLILFRFPMCGSISRLYLIGSPKLMYNTSGNLARPCIALPAPNVGNGAGWLDCQLCLSSVCARQTIVCLLPWDRPVNGRDAAVFVNLGPIK